MKYTNFKGQIGLFIGGIYLVFLGYNQIYFRDTGSQYSNLTQTFGITSPHSYGAYLEEILVGIFLVFFAVIWFFKNLKSKK